MPNLNLDEKTHIYTLDNKRLISVTQALAILNDRWKVDPFYLERGSLIDLACEYYDIGELDEDSVDPQIKGYFEGYKKFIIETKFKVVYPKPREGQIKLYHPEYFYAGKPDVIGILNGDLDLIDRKSGAKAIVNQLQGAAYWELCRVNNIPIKKVFDLYLKDDGNYSLVEVENPKLLLRIFLAALTLTRFKEEIS
ncbi:hypothetical protein KKE60_07325 [Patescibacteria group bacterium]|nr:hypothetical protein [Patescibacteria group bacterium]